MARAEVAGGREGPERGAPGQECHRASYCYRSASGKRRSENARQEQVGICRPMRLGGSEPFFCVPPTRESRGAYFYVCRHQFGVSIVQTAAFFLKCAIAVNGAFGDCMLAPPCRRPIHP